MASRCWEDAILGINDLALSHAVVDQYQLNGSWMSLLLIALIGDQFGLGDEMCGVVMSTKFKEDTLSFWHRTAENKEITTKIRDTIKRVLGIAPNVSLEYKPHDQVCHHTLHLHWHAHMLIYARVQLLINACDGCT
jgi:hypothetical protein